MVCCIWCWGNEGCYIDLWSRLSLGQVVAEMGKWFVVFGAGVMRAVTLTFGPGCPWGKLWLRWGDGLLYLVLG